jgi:hypothetical protein
LKFTFAVIPNSDCATDTKSSSSSEYGKIVVIRDMDYCTYCGKLFGKGDDKLGLTNEGPDIYTIMGASIFHIIRMKKK